MKKTILVVEDEKLSRKLIVGTLINHGFECLTAENGQYALNILKDNYCDLILSNPPFFFENQIIKSISTTVPELVIKIF